MVTTTGAYNGSINAGESALALTLGGFAGGLLSGADGIIFSEGNIATTGFLAGSNAHLLGTEKGGRSSYSAPAVAQRR